jgi:parallel beta-helix repeat protein
MRNHRLVRLIGAVGLGVAGLGSTGVLVPSLGSGVAGAVGCTPAGTTGLTASVVATGVAITAQTVTATGCDIGIYVPPGDNGQTITTTTVSGANDEGIFAEQVTGLSITHSTIQNNAANPNPALQSDGGITLAGVANSTVDSNTVTGNNSGGIYVVDNGPVDPGAPNPGPGAPVPATNDTVSNNILFNNPAGCGIIFATHNAGGSVVGGSITGNSITGSPGVFTKAGPDVGGIVVAAASPSATVSNVSVTNNTVTGSYEGGIIVHAHAPHDVVTGTTITGNTLPGGNNWGLTNGPPATAGVIIGIDLLPAALAPTITSTTVSANTISNQFYGIWISGVPGVVTTPANLISVSTGGTAIYQTPTPGKGYWLAATDGGIFNYGNAGFNGSAGGMTLNKPIVGIAATQDQGGYWLAASDGGIFTYGDASFFGSAGNIKLNKPVVGIAATPYVPAAGGAPASPAGLGYWLAASDGGIFNYGDAAFGGSAGGIHLNKPITALGS